MPEECSFFFTFIGSRTGRGFLLIQNELTVLYNRKGFCLLCGTK